MTNAHNTNEFKATLTSFSQLISAQTGISKIEIPLIQRDYAQGRNTPSVNDIRTKFVESICGALRPDAPSITLDFVYGDADKCGTFMPLDGQQRLTLLFLLHCYLAWRTEENASKKSWAAFSYATRPSARNFCTFLTTAKPIFSEKCPLFGWIKDQAEYLPTWDFDPTIHNMLVVLDGLHNWFEGHEAFDFKDGYARLTTKENPAIQFHLLPMKANGMTDAQYIKMNSRGKPLTLFENFKAQFEEILKDAHPDKVEDIAKKIDREWSDLLWQHRGKDNLIDDKFLRYFRFVTEVCAWNSGKTFDTTKGRYDLTYLDDIAKKAYGQNDEQSKANLDFLCYAFDMWTEQTKAAIDEKFKSVFTGSREDAGNSLLIFSPFKDEGVNFFQACCEHYGTETWNLGHSLMLYGVLLHGGAPPSNCQQLQRVEVQGSVRPLRVLRNLIEASPNEIRMESMQGLLRDVEHIILRGAICNVGTFNTAQKTNEEAKIRLLAVDINLQEVLHALEDHDLLRGGLRSFNFDAITFKDRANRFMDIFKAPKDPSDEPWMRITGSLLAKGDYCSKGKSREDGMIKSDFGAPKNNEPWQTLFRARGQNTPSISQPLMALLDANNKSPNEIINDYLGAADTVKDWRYYFVKYSEMRKGSSGFYYLKYLENKGYDARMLDKTSLGSYYSDPYLRAVVKLGEVKDEEVSNPDLNAAWPHAYTGSENAERWMEISSLNIRLRSADKGWDVSSPTRLEDWQKMANAVDADVRGKDKVTVSEPRNQVFLIAMPQTDGIDTIDRIEWAAAMLKQLQRPLAELTAPVNQE